MNPPEPTAKDIFNDAIEMADSDRRMAYLDQVCAGRPDLRQRVDALLCAHGKLGDFLEEPPTEVIDPAAQIPPSIGPVRLGAGGTKGLIGIIEKTGDRIGRYKLLQQIGEGGCGVVFMAEQEEPVRRRVALKVIKLGMDTKSVIARFEAERQALAMMDHPNIAKVLDAGSTNNGRPFFVMELVRGIPLTQYCDENNLPTPQRLDLFIKVCHAIQHAHQKGIIHRDIKPSNILVTLHDGVPVPKVIDFGIAKATESRLTELTLFTELNAFIGTPAYTSPEQAEMSGLDIDTRSDIYSLGVLLYELLTGRLPFNPETLVKAGLDEMRRTIREEEPPRPSTRVSTLDGADLSTIARKRGIEAAELSTLIRGDLDWITMKCLEKDRTRRYETANGLALDIRRHLTNEPVVACPPSAGYLMAKLIRRHKGAFVALGAIALTLVAGIVASSWNAVRAARAEAEAISQAKKSDQVARFLKEMLQGVGPSRALGRDTRMLRDIMDRTATRLGRDLKDQPAVEAGLRQTLGNVYLDLGVYQSAEAMLRQALAMQQNLLGKEHAEIASCLVDLSSVLVAQGKRAEAEAMLRDALAMQKRLLGPANPAIAMTLKRLGDALDAEGKWVEGESAIRQALEIMEKLYGRDNLAVANVKISLALALNGQRKHSQAAALYREVLASQRRLLGDENPTVSVTLNNLAIVLQSQGNLKEAEEVFREALPAQRKIYGDQHPEVAAVMDNFAGVLRDENKLVEAERMEREALAMRQRLLGNENPYVALSLSTLAEILKKKGDFAGAEPLFLEALRVRESGTPRIEFRIHRILEDLSSLYAAWARSDATKGADADLWKQRLTEFEKAESAKKAPGGK